MYPSSSLLGHDKVENEALPVDELIEKADGFAGVYPGMYLNLFNPDRKIIVTVGSCSYLEDMFRSLPFISVFHPSSPLFQLTEHKYEIVKILQEKHHICGMTGDGVNDAPALKKADIGIAVSDATDAARGAADLVLTEPGLSVIISAVLTSRAIFQRMKNYTVEYHCIIRL